MTGKRMVSMMIALILPLSMAACSNANKDKEIVKSNEEELTGNVTVWSYTNSSNALEAVGRDFVKKYPKVTVKVEHLEKSDLNKKLAEAISSKNGLPDVAAIDSDYIKEHVNKFPGEFTDVSDSINSVKDSFTKNRLSEVTVKDKMYAFPWLTAPVGLFYRADIFESCGINAQDIKTWDDFVEIGKIINTKTQMKMLPMNIGNDDILYRQLLSQLGVYYFDKDGKPVLNSQESIKAVSILKKLNDAKLILYSNNYIDLISNINNNKIVAVPGSVEWSNELTKLPGTWKLMRFPAFEPGGRNAASNPGSELAVLNSSKNKKTSIEFAKYAALNIQDEIGYLGGQQAWIMFADIIRDIPDISYTRSSTVIHDKIIDAQKRILLEGADIKSTLDNEQNQISNK